MVVLEQRAADTEPEQAASERSGSVVQLVEQWAGAAPDESVDGAIGWRRTQRRLASLEEQLEALAARVHSDEDTASEDSGSEGSAGSAGSAVFCAPRSPKAAPAEAHDPPAGARDTPVVAALLEVMRQQQEQILSLQAELLIGELRVRSAGDKADAQTCAEVKEERLRAMASSLTLPPPWEERASRATGDVYYFNRNTGRSTYDRPTALPPPWQEAVSRFKYPGDTYYFNPRTQDASFERPTELEAAAAAAAVAPTAQPEASKKKLRRKPPRKQTQKKKAERKKGEKKERKEVGDKGRRAKTARGAAGDGGCKCGGRVCSCLW